MASYEEKYAQLKEKFISATKKKQDLLEKVEKSRRDVRIMRKENEQLLDLCIEVKKIEPIETSDESDSGSSAAEENVEPRRKYHMTAPKGTTNNDKRRRAERIVTMGKVVLVGPPRQRENVVVSEVNGNTAAPAAIGV
ncbi:hypothetical protein HK104_006124 [Borealophlyctis nickersoniae]|nr:hypothetical protein HK104_006124 [Borealophlyctis nickersoniae]